MPTKKKNPVVASEKIFSENFKKLLLKKEITYLEFAQMQGLERHRVERWLKALCFPKHSVLIQICDFFEYRDIYTLLTRPIK